MTRFTAGFPDCCCSAPRRARRQCRPARPCGGHWRRALRPAGARPANFHRAGRRGAPVRPPGPRPPSAARAMLRLFPRMQFMFRFVQRQRGGMRSRHRQFIFCARQFQVQRRIFGRTMHIAAERNRQVAPTLSVLGPSGAFSLNARPPAVAAHHCPGPARCPAHCAPARRRPGRQHRRITLRRVGNDFSSGLAGSTDRPVSVLQANRLCASSTCASYSTESRSRRAASADSFHRRGVARLHPLRHIVLQRAIQIDIDIWPAHLRFRPAAPATRFHAARRPHASDRSATPLPTAG
jgi:hypothetical protein